jgi:hypothetical protein
MIKHAFRQLFQSALESALEMGRVAIREPALHSIKIELHAPNAPGRSVSFDEALDEIYLGEDRFYKIIDVAAWQTQAHTVAFVRVSGHLPCPFGQTWDPSGLGPFKPVIAEAIPNRGYEAAK